MTTYLALLRAINLGGHQQVAMADLRDLLRQLGFRDPQSLLQTGNLVFGGQTRTTAALERLLEAEAEKRLALQMPSPTGDGGRERRNTGSSTGRSPSSFRSP